MLKSFYIVVMFASSLNYRTFAGEDMNKIEDVLTRLEKKIIQSDAPIQNVDRQINNAQNAETLEFQPKKVTTDLKEQRDLNAIAKQAQTIASRVEQLESEVQKTRQQVLDDAKLEQSLAINLQLLPRSASFLRSARVYLDGYEIYSVEQPQGLWTSSEILPVYLGPTQTGSHKLVLEVSVIHRHDNKLGLNAEQFQATRLEYPFTIVTGANVNLSFAIKAKDSKKSEIILEANNTTPVAHAEKEANGE